MMGGGAKESIQRHPFFTKVQTEINLSAFRFNTLLLPPKFKKSES